MMRHDSGIGRTGLAAALAVLLVPWGVGAEIAGESQVNVGEQLLGATLRSEEGEKVGTIKDLVIDERGRIQILVVEGGAGRLHIPWQGTQLRLGAGQVVINRSQHELVGPAGAGEAGQPSPTRRPAIEQPAGGKRLDVAPARGTQPQDPVGISFSALDADGDGAIVPAEAQRSVDLRARFEELDLNGDGRLDRAEYSAFEIEPSGPTTAVAEGARGDGSESQQRPSAQAPAGSPALQTQAARGPGAGDAETGMAERGPIGGDGPIDIPEPGEDRSNPSLQGSLAQGGGEQPEGRSEEVTPPATGGGGQQDRPGGTPEHAQAQPTDRQAQDQRALGEQGGDPQAQARQAGEEEPNFAELDSDRDGVLTREEAQRSPRLMERFRDYDRDNDGRLTRAEFVVYAALAPEEGERTEAFNRLDVNGDGVLSQAETEAQPRLHELFIELDKDSDGSLSPSEFAAFEQAQDRQQRGARQED